MPATPSPFYQDFAHRLFHALSRRYAKAAVDKYRSALLHGARAKDGSFCDRGLASVQIARTVARRLRQAERSLRLSFCSATVAI